jgi:hypothetical protein
MRHPLVGQVAPLYEVGDDVSDQVIGRVPGLGDLPRGQASGLPSGDPVR